MAKSEKQILKSISQRVLYFVSQMVYSANHRDNAQKGDPKVGGHPAACASALHILGALHLLVKTGFDHIANKPHASPSDHSYNYLLDLLLNKDLSRLNAEQARQCMFNLRAFPQNGEPVFQSYHSAHDPDHHNFFPSGTVGIPPVNAGYLALAYRYAKDHGFEVPDAHFWAVVGDSEFREGSLFEGIPDFAERELGNLTWIVDYNRQSLDGHRITNKEIMHGTDAARIQRTMEANGWEVIQVRHGALRRELFRRPGGEHFRKFLEENLDDYELQSLLLVHDMTALKKGLVEHHKELKTFLENVSDKELFDSFRDLGGHDIFALAEAMERSKKNSRQPTLIVAHTIKGWSLKMAAAQGNHSSIPALDEVEELKKSCGIFADKDFERYDVNSDEGQFLKERSEQLYSEILEQHEIKKRNQAHFSKSFEQAGDFTDSLDINLKLASYPHTQWMLGQLTAKLSRFADTPEEESKLAKGQKALAEIERPWKKAGELLVHMAPDVGTSTNLNPTMDGKIFGAPMVEDFESEFGVKNSKLPDLVPSEEKNDRYLRFEIAEANVMSCLGSFGKMREILGIPLLPLMTVYDFFIKRALDQYFYDLYWKSSFILVGTPSGITLSPEGAQHGWKSDFQIPNQITWEPLYCQELDWILCDSIKRHIKNDNEGRTGVVIRGVTKGLEQKEQLVRLQTHKRYKQEQSSLLCHNNFPMPNSVPENTIGSIPQEEILEQLKVDVLKGAYYLIDYRGYAGYDPGDNVVHIFAMGAMGEEAVRASDELLNKGIYANVIIVTSSDLLNGNLGHLNDFEHLRHGLQINANLYVYAEAAPSSAELATISGKRIPIVSVHDGEPGLLDNLGSIVGVRHECLAVRKHSKCGRPMDVYQYHGIDSQAIIQACGKVLAETALEPLKVRENVLNQAAKLSPQGHWQQLWS